MGVVYFRNTADSGDGSFRAALDAAGDGDVIMPDPTVFRRGEVLTITLSGLAQVKRSAELRGGVCRVRLVSVSGISLYARNDCEFLTVEGFEFVGRVVAYFRNVRFERCRFGGNSEDSYLLQGTSRQAVEVVDSILTGARRGGAYIQGPESSFTLLRSTVAGCREPMRVAATVEYSAVDSIVDPDVESAGFVIAPPSTLASYVGALPWESWDLTPTPSSPYASGGESCAGEYDAVGAPRGRTSSAGASTSYAVGALEVVEADYYLVGGVVAGGVRFDAPENWSTSRSEVVAPSTVEAGRFWIDASTEWLDAPPDGSTLLVMNRAAVTLAPPTSSPPEVGAGTRFTAIVGAGASLESSGSGSTAAALYLGKGSLFQGELTTASELTLGKDSEFRFSQDASLDELIVGDNARLVFSGTDRVVRTLGGSCGADVVMTVEEGGSESGDAPARGYFAAPSTTLTEFDSATFVGVARCVLGAGLTSFLATATSPGETTLSWSATTPESAIRLESRRSGASCWELVAAEVAANVESMTVAAPNGRVHYRAFDGERFWLDDGWSFSALQLRVVATVTTSERRAQVWEVVTELATTTEEIMTGQGITILARIFDAFDTSAPLLATDDNVESVTYTCYYLSNGLFSETLTPVAGHEEVDAGVECVLEAPQLSDAWNVDSVGYTFVLAPDIRDAPLFEKAGDYRIKVVVKLRVGNPVVFYVPVTVVER